jgi:hypothetical protein
VFVIGCKHKFVRMAHPARMTSPLVTTEIEALVNSWRRDLRARNLAPKTIKTYGESAVTVAADVSREDVSDFITDLLAMRSTATTSVRLRALQQSSPGSSTVRRQAYRRWRSGGGFGSALSAMGVAASRRNLRSCRRPSAGGRRRGSGGSGRGGWLDMGGKATSPVGRVDTAWDHPRTAGDSARTVGAEVGRWPVAGRGHARRERGRRRPGRHLECGAWCLL